MSVEVSFHFLWLLVGFVQFLEVIDKVSGC